MAQLAWAGEGFPFNVLNIGKCALITVFSNELNVHYVFSFKMIFKSAWEHGDGTPKYSPKGAFFHVL